MNDWDIFEQMKSMQREMDRLFSNFWDRPMLGYERDITRERSMVPAETRMPACHMQETETGIIADIELPGASKDEIELNVTDDMIEVKVEQKKEKKDKHSHYMSSQQFYRRIGFPQKVDSSKAKASYRNGILRVEAPKIQLKGSKRLQIE
ncbi:Hsp20/alpha crystallin family protein [Candidatus Woesearchaeota archaeon]|nr:Hsp20/alpha crystallin family protein [Candidatus Woesearchaeota archaeon]